MPRINLLPVRAARKRDVARNELFMTVGALAGMLFLLFLWYGTVESEIGEIEDSLEVVNTQIAHLSS